LSISIYVYCSAPEKSIGSYITTVTMLGIKKVREQKKYFMLANECFTPKNDEIAAQCLRSTTILFGPTDTNIFFWG